MCQKDDMSSLCTEWALLVAAGCVLGSVYCNDKWHGNKCFLARTLVICLNTLLSGTGHHCVQVAGQTLVV